MMAVDSDLFVAARFFGGMTRFSGGIMSVGVTRDALYIVAPSVVRFFVPNHSTALDFDRIGQAVRGAGLRRTNRYLGDGLQIQAEYEPGFRGAEFSPS